MVRDFSVRRQCLRERHSTVGSVALFLSSWAAGRLLRNALIRLVNVLVCVKEPSVIKTGLLSFFCMERLVWQDQVPVKLEVTKTVAKISIRANCA